MVIAIIAILAGMILPTLGKAKEKANTIACANNLRQLTLAMQMYGDENNELLPMAGGLVGWNDTNPVPWTRPLLSYYHTTNVLRCTSMAQAYKGSIVNYFMGSRGAYVAAGNQRASVNLRSIRFPSAYILSGDCNYDFGLGDADPDNYSQDTLFKEDLTAHNGLVNVLFADGHVRAYKMFKPADMTYSYTELGLDF